MHCFNNQFVYKLDSSELHRAISQLQDTLDPQILVNLKFMCGVITLKEIPETDNAKQFYIEKLITQFTNLNNDKYLNLQGADLRNFELLKLAGVNFKNAIFHHMLEPVNIITKDAFLSADKMERELNQLSIQINRKDSEEKRRLRNGVLHDFKKNIEILFRNISSSELDKAKKLLSLVNILLKHPIKSC